MCDSGGAAPSTDKDGKVRKDSDDTDHRNAPGIRGIDIGAYEYDVGAIITLSCPTTP